VGAHHRRRADYTKFAHAYMFYVHQRVHTCSQFVLSLSI
jgi:hypothetical protein